MDDFSGGSLKRTEIFVRIATTERIISAMDQSLRGESHDLFQSRKRAAPRLAKIRNPTTIVVTAETLC